MDGVTVITENGGVDVITSQKVISAAPSGWDDMVAEYGIGYDYPPTGSLTIRRTGDDADIDQTLFTAAIRDANSLKPQQSLASFFVLNNNSVWGTKVRFTDELGTEIFANNLMLDNLTGIMTYMVVQSAVTWNNAIDNALASTQGGLADWFLPSNNQFVQYLVAGNYLTSFSPLNISENLWSSTTLTNNTSRAYFSQNINNFAASSSGNKVNSKAYIICRKHF